MAHYRPHDLLNVVLLLVELEDEQGRLLDAIAAGPIITIEDVVEAGILPVAPTLRSRRSPDEAKAVGHVPRSPPRDSWGDQCGWACSKD